MESELGYGETKWAEWKTGWPVWRVKRMRSGAGLALQWDEVAPAKVALGAERKDTGSCSLSGD